jgi:hypothetical protein
MVIRDGYFRVDDGDSLYGVRLALRADELLRGDCYYQSVYDDPLCRG